jgi:hypothetical protein
MFKQPRNVLPILVGLLLILLSACQQTPDPLERSATELSGNWRETELILPGYDKPQKVIYEIVGDEAIFEGDIILGKVDAQGNLIKSDFSPQGIVRDGGRWSGGIIPFVINGNVTASGIQHINEAIAHWEEKTPINFVPRTSQSNYVEFVRGDSAGACSSRVGLVGGRQEIKLTPSGDCSRGALIHEIGHAVGLYHEQSREDRDNFVTIMWANIASGREHNFERRVDNASDVNNYDHGSIMHYGAFDFCKKNSSGSCVGPTIVTKPAGISIGQRSGLSQGDITTVLAIYPIVKHPRFVEDVSGDGRKDVVAFGNDGVYVSLSTGSGFTAPSRWTRDYSHNNGFWRSDKHLRLLGDVNGDGKQDIVGFGDAGVYSSLSTGFSFGQARFVVNEFGYNQGWRIANHPRVLADVNGDGKQDIVGFANEGVYVSLSTSTATAPAFSTATRWLENFGVNQGWQVAKHPRFLADANGDGRQDVVGFGDAGVWTALSTGSGFGQASFVLADFGYNAGGFRVELHPRFLADVNGDGRQDVVAINNDSVWVSLSTGSGFGSAGLWLPGSFAPNQGWRVDRHPRFLADINADGKRDIVGFGDAGVWVSLSTGSSFTAASFVLADFGYDQAWRIGKNPRFLADMSGDGKQDIVAFGDAGIWRALSAGSSFGQANFVLAKYGYNDGWR